MCNSPRVDGMGLVHTWLAEFMKEIIANALTYVNIWMLYTYTIKWIQFQQIASIYLLRTGLYWFGFHVSIAPPFTIQTDARSVNFLPVVSLLYSTSQKYWVLSNDQS